MLRGHEWGWLCTVFPEGHIVTWGNMSRDHRGRLFLRRSQRLRKAWCETGREWHQVEEVPQDPCLAVGWTYIANGRGGFLESGPYNGSFSVSFRTSCFFACLIFQRGLCMSSQMPFFFLSHKRKVFTCSVFFYLKLSCGGGGSTSLDFWDQPVPNSVS